jgi:hypothetical protein
MMSCRFPLSVAELQIYELHLQKASQALQGGMCDTVGMPEARHASAAPPHILGGSHVRMEVYKVYHVQRNPNKWDIRLMHFLRQSLGLFLWNSSTELEVASCGHSSSAASDTPDCNSALHCT